MKKVKARTKVTRTIPKKRVPRVGSKKVYKK